MVDWISGMEVKGTSGTRKVRSQKFIKDNQKQKIEVFIIVHGIGTGILKNTTFETLKKNKQVLEFKQYYYNTGCMLVRIKL